MAELITQYPQFLTATNLEWKKLLESDKHKDVIISSLRFLVEQKRIRVYGFVIMWNHLHLIWQMIGKRNYSSVQRDFLKFTGQRIKQLLLNHNPGFLECFKVAAADREYQFWERSPLSIEIRNSSVFFQKLNYLHNNPVRAGICATPGEYEYSSALFYETGIDNWGFLTHYNG